MRRPSPKLEFGLNFGFGSLGSSGGAPSSGGSPVPVFQAALTSDLTDAYGNGTATFTRATVATQVVGGVVIKYASGEARISSGGLLMEGARANQCPYSEDIANGWNVNASVTATSNYGTAPDGTATSDRIQYAGGAGSPTTREVDQIFAISGGAASKVIANSVWVKGSGTFRIKSTHVGVLNNYSSDLTATSEWVRYDYTVTNGATAGTGNARLGICAGTADGAYDLEVWGWQTEDATAGGPQGPTSYVPTESAAVTRNADVLTYAGNWDVLCPDSAGSFYCIYTPDNDGSFAQNCTLMSFSSTTGSGLAGNGANLEIEDGTTTATAAHGGMTAGTEIALSGRWSTALDELQAIAGATTGTADVYDDSMTRSPADTLHIGDLVWGRIRQIELY